MPNSLQDNDVSSKDSSFLLRSHDALQATRPKMVPEILSCECCGRTVIVLGWSPIYDDATELALADDSHTLEITCKIDCPHCGPRIQRVKPSQAGAAPNAA
jgi:hypothetical protein